MIEIGGAYQKWVCLLYNKICAHDSKGTHEQNKANGFKLTLVLPIVSFYIILKFPLLLSVHMTQPEEPLLSTKIYWSMCNPCGVDKITTNSKKVHFQRHQIKLNCWWFPIGAPGSERSMRSPSCVFTPWLEHIFSWGLTGETSLESTALPNPAVVVKVLRGCDEDFLLEVRPPRSCWLYTSCCGRCDMFVMPSPSKSVSPWSTSGAIGGCSIGLAKMVVVHMESSRSGNEMMCKTMYANNWRTPSAISSHTPLMKNSAAAFRMAETIVAVVCLFNVRCRIEEGSGHVSCGPAPVIVCLHIEKQWIQRPYHLIQSNWTTFVQMDVVHIEKPWIQRPYQMIK